MSIGELTPAKLKLPSRSVSMVPALLERRVRGTSIGTGEFEALSAEVPGVALARTVPKTSKLWIVETCFRTRRPRASIV